MLTIDVINKNLLIITLNSSFIFESCHKVCIKEGCMSAEVAVFADYCSRIKNHDFGFKNKRCNNTFYLYICFSQNCVR